jgi:hypothetical protein
MLVLFIPSELTFFSMAIINKHAPCFVFIVFEADRFLIGCHAILLVTVRSLYGERQGVI